MSSRLVKKEEDGTINNFIPGSIASFFSNKKHGRLQKSVVVYLFYRNLKISSDNTFVHVSLKSPFYILGLRCCDKIQYLVDGRFVYP